MTEQELREFLRNNLELNWEYIDDDVYLVLSVCGRPADRVKLHNFKNY